MRKRLLAISLSAMIGALAGVFCFTAASPAMPNLRFLRGAETVATSSEYSPITDTTSRTAIYRLERPFGDVSSEAMKELPGSQITSGAGKLTVQMPRSKRSIFADVTIDIARVGDNSVAVRIFETSEATVWDRIGNMVSPLSGRI